MYRILVCDDNKEFLKLMVLLLEKYAGAYDAMVIGCEGGHDLLAYCWNNKLDLIYMDIVVGRENGMSLAKAIKAMNPRTLIVYVSAYDDYYVDMVQAEPFRFISKDASDIPKLEKQIADTLEAAMRRINGREIWSFVFDRKKYYIELGRIKYFYSMARTIHIVGNLDDAPDYYYGGLDELEKELERIDGNFVRISKRHIINMKYIKVMGKKKVGIDHKVFNVTGKYMEKFIERCAEYWSLHT
ncbi:LytR/AlgR family response regulator transcription factor [Parablautia muri]|uniref:Stage 0 sporulation protein A homolog n=1 Tax=Parablautia muri TaxID=2320879 RepID=A0A9X5BGT1_9FIRM|nr:LytTR family DNA-binding domain-containing protein [Parablautia muri]NBJ93620.1 DNA-binding response regulator [Parablautia muri]